ncbi:Glycosyltransferase involved in cell wall bisynthesis [Prevotella sp. khp1]|uniref:glycosyltransferase family 4 protein n=1 Tax=Prevotellaceae TaxID=171552 RepID=UPI00088A9B73|nr:MULTISPECIES: glycosyltransferase family 4 protein [Prevotellaceae]SDQ16028.1 Glycosyltransferase involved in cell wall bisynthesis [Prevotella sp. khp1]
MKLAFLCNNMKSTNGVERVLSQRLSLLAESGMYKVYLITYNQYGAPFSFPISDKVHYVDLATRYIERCSYHGLFQYFDRYVSRKIFIRLFRHCVERINPDVVTCVDMHLADLEAVLSLKNNVVKVVECHCGLSAYFEDLEKIENRYRRNRERSLKQKLIRIIGKFDRIVVLTKDERVKWHLGDKVVFIPNMLVSYPEDLPEHTITHNQIISVGRYAYQKGYDLLMEAWKIVEGKHPDWSLHIYGSHDGDMGDYGRLLHIIDDSRMQNVYLHPATNEVYSKYVESDFYVMSSRFESFGLVLIEAMSCGLPIVSFDCNYGPRSIVTDGETGILVPPYDVKKLALSICFMIEHNDERMKMGRNARVAILKYKPERIISFWQHFYQSL